MENHCDEHSGVCETVKIIKERSEQIERAIPKLMKNSTMWAFLSIFVVICLAIIGFLISGQDKILYEVKNNREQTLSKIQENTDQDVKYRRKMDRKMDLLMWKTGISFKDRHDEDDSQ